MSCHSYFLSHALAVPFPEVPAHVILSMLDIFKILIPENIRKGYLLFERSFHFMQDSKYSLFKSNNISHFITTYFRYHFSGIKLPVNPCHLETSLDIPDNSKVKLTINCYDISLNLFIL